MEVLTHSPNASVNDPFDFNNARILSAPSSPKRFGDLYYLSAPSSPSRFAASYYPHDADDGFAFFVTGELNSPRSAEELFHGGKIKPLKEEGAKAQAQAQAQERRGRERNLSFSSSNTNARVARSLSPNHSNRRISHYTWDEDSGPATVSATNKTSSTSRKWRLRDFLLFRSASEGRGSSKDPLRKFPTFYRKPQDPIAPPKSTRKEPLSAHELHYTLKKAESQDMKKKTFLPYKQGILARLTSFGFK
ncbi:hypothetical protein VNO78_00481 [Psophocarpus tetragonolobus]|uniref:Uncharacterized protein n=1 Tax=Psophocarpus tetragonolobus TaxID=3891 RepID=A0AAN9T9C6_PSOTE